MRSGTAADCFCGTIGDGVEMGVARLLSLSVHR